MSQPPIVDEPGVGRLQIWPLPTDEATLLALVTDVFSHYWEHIHFGVIVPGAAWEVAAPNPPRKISTMDGYVTVDFGRWHFHLCIGEHTASGPELGRIRRCARAEFTRSIGMDGAPTSWSLRMFNGEDTQLMTVMLPNPAGQPARHPQQPVVRARVDQRVALGGVRGHERRCCLADQAHGVGRGDTRAEAGDALPGHLVGDIRGEQPGRKAGVLRPGWCAWISPVGGGLPIP